MTSVKNQVLRKFYCFEICYGAKNFVFCHNFFADKRKGFFKKEIFALISQFMLSLIRDLICFQSRCSVLDQRARVPACPQTDSAAWGDRTTEEGTLYAEEAPQELHSV